MRVIQRDWLSSNQVMFFDGEGDACHATLIDSGYVKHAPLTVGLVSHLLQQRGLAAGALQGIVSIGDVVKHRIDELQVERDQLVGYLHQ